MASQDELRREAERERKEREDAEYERGWRKGWARAKAIGEVRIEGPLDPYKSGLNDGFNAGGRGEPNRFPIVSSVFFVLTRDEAEQALGRIRAHPECQDLGKWSIDEITDRPEPGYAINYNWDMDTATRLKWMDIAKKKGA